MLSRFFRRGAAVFFLAPAVRHQNDTVISDGLPAALTGAGAALVVRHEVLEEPFAASSFLAAAVHGACPPCTERIAMEGPEVERVRARPLRLRVCAKRRGG